MPQLDPALWFSILILAWCTLLIVIATIVAMHTYPNLPGEKKEEDKKKDAKKPTKNHWGWPWQ